MRGCSSLSGNGSPCMRITWKLDCLLLHGRQTFASSRTRQRKHLPFQSDSRVMTARCITTSRTIRSFSRGFSAYLDASRMRYRRILVPFAAHLWRWARSMGGSSAYSAVILLSVFWAAIGSARLRRDLGFDPACGLAFLLVPATLISMDRLTVDVALVALCVAFALFVGRDSLGRTVCAYCGRGAGNSRNRTAAHRRLRSVAVLESQMFRALSSSRRGVPRPGVVSVGRNPYEPETFPSCPVSRFRD